jgi:hypothetical protein
MRGLAIGAAACALALCACGGNAASPQGVVSDTTTAVYNDDLNAMQSHFDDALQKQVTLDGVSALSQKLHAFGAFQGLSQIAADPTGGRYDYTANFDHGTMTIHVRMDGDGRIAAYRIDVPQSVAARD